MGTRVYEFGPYRLDAEKSVLWRADTVVPLTPKALALLDPSSRPAETSSPRPI